MIFLIGVTRRKEKAKSDRRDSKTQQRDYQHRFSVVKPMQAEAALYSTFRRDAGQDGSCHSAWTTPWRQALAGGNEGLASP